MVVAVADRASLQVGLRIKAGVLQRGVTGDSYRMPDRQKLHRLQHRHQHEMRLLTFSRCAPSFLPSCRQSFRPEANLIMRTIFRRFISSRPLDP